MTRIGLIVFGVLVLMWVAIGCTDGSPSKRYGRQFAQTRADCQDTDGDGRGEGCALGPDCHDGDPSIWEGCGHCADPAVDCSCEVGALPQRCFLEPSDIPDGGKMCHEGTRYCRDGSWSACEDIVTYPEPQGPVDNAIIDPDAGPVQCSLCNPICFRITDPLGPIDGGLGSGNSNQVDWAQGGGLTLKENPPPLDAGPDAGPPACVLGVAPDRDCDGIDDEFDPYPDSPPFATDNPAIFLDIPPGETGIGEIDLTFTLNSADIYFLVDQSGSMSDERDTLVNDLTTGDFINDAAYACADNDFDGMPDNYLKTEGILGAIGCYIRDTQFGVGFFREIPFTGYADNQHIAFGNSQDITADFVAMQSAVAGLSTVGNYEWPEASTPALYNLVSGDGMYFGVDKRGIAPRVDCPAGRWGYPCFRQEAMPIVIMITDAMMHNGPPDNAYAYNPANLTMQTGTQPGFTSVDGGFEAFASAYSAGDLTNELITFTGTTAGMSEDVPAQILSCLDADGGVDAVFQFSLSQTRTVLLSTEGSQFDTVLGLYSGVPIDPTLLPDSDNTNETADSTQALGSINSEVLIIEGDTGSMAADYDGPTVGCGAASSTPDAVYRFTLGQDTAVNIDTEGSATDTVIALYGSKPTTAPAYTAIVDKNDDLATANDLGEIYKGQAYVSGNTAAVTIDEDFTGQDIGCGADSLAGDAVHSFTLSQATRVRISTEGSGHDTVIALVGNTCQGGGGGGGGGTAPVDPDEGGGNTSASSGGVHSFQAGSFIIPMDTDYQDSGMFRGYGLVFALLTADIPVSWIIKKGKAKGEADFTVASIDHASGDPVAAHGYRAGPFVIDASDASDALAIIDDWQSDYPEVTVHEAAASFSGYVRKHLVAAPNIAMFADGNQDIARSYMQAAGIADSTGDPGWPDSSPDMIDIDEGAGPTTASHTDGALFDANGKPAYCQMMSMHWSNGGATQAVGDEVIAEYRDFLQWPVHLFAECQAVIAIENNASGRFLTSDGFEWHDQPGGGVAGDYWDFTHDDLPFAQFDGPFQSTGGTLPAYTLPAGTSYKDSDVVMITDNTSPSGTGDVWMTGYRDGVCSILEENCDPSGDLGLPKGKVSYLGGHVYMPRTPLSGHGDAQGTRLFLNALFEADCATDLGMPSVRLDVSGPGTSMASEVTYTFSYINDGGGLAFQGTLQYPLPTNVTFVSATDGGSSDGTTVQWDLGTLDIGEVGSVSVTVNLENPGTFDHYAVLNYKQGVTERRAVTPLLTTAYSANPDNLCTIIGSTSRNVPTGAEDAAGALDIGQLDDNIFLLAGTTASMDSDFTEAYLGCSADDAAPDAVVKFSLAAATDVEISSAGSGFDTVIALMDAPVDTVESFVSDDTNETTALAQDLGTIDGKVFQVSGSTTGRTADHTATEISCGPSSTNSPDVAFKFTVGSATRVQIDTYGSYFDTLVSLHDGEIVAGESIISLSIGNDNETPPSAYMLPSDLDGSVHAITGSTSGMDPNFALSCTAFGQDAGPDAVVRFTVTNPGTYELNTDGSDFDTSLALYPVPAGTDEPPAVAVSGNTPVANAFDMGTADWWHHFTGTTSTDNFDEEHCGAHKDARDAFFEFQLDADAQVNINTYYSAFDTAIALYRWDDPSHTTYTYVSCDLDGGAAPYANSSDLTEDLIAGDYFIVVTGDDNNDRGDYDLQVRPTALGADNAIDCDDNSGADGIDSKLTHAFAAGDYYAVIKGHGNSDSGTYVLNLVDPAVPIGPGDPNIIDCNDDTGGSQSFVDSVTDLAAGDYWVVVKGAGQFDDGKFQLTLTDVGNRPPGAVRACDDDSGPDADGTSLMTFTALPAGNYWAVIKGDAAADKGVFGLKIRDTSAPEASVIECDDDDGEQDSSVIERQLDAGKYQVIVKGDGAADEGPYQLAVRDVTNLGYARITCDDDSGPGQTSAISADLTPGSYYVVIKGDEPGDAGGYRLRVRNQSTPDGDVACNDDGGSGGTSVIQQELGPGTYFAAVKGYDAPAQGGYQLTMGGASPINSTYVPPTWSETLSALQSTQTRVITVLSCQDDPVHGDASGDCGATRDQATDLANATDTLGAALQPLVFDINRDGAGLSGTVVDGIASLTQYLEMDIEVQVLFEWDANPPATPFLVSIVAVADPTDDCVGVIGNVFQDCKPGATPSFQILFTNPAANPVPLNPDDPNGGYNFKAQLIGNGRFVLDEVPIYIIPDDVVPNKNDVPVFESGVYWQDLLAEGCVSADNERPDWDEMSWTGVVPRGANITFKACAGDTPAELDSCTAYTIAAIDGVGACTTDADCPLGYCDTDYRTCQVATANSCAGDTDCATNATCVGSVCTFSSQPVSIGKALKGLDGMAQDNLKPYLRVYIEMSVMDEYDPPPVLYEWSLTYLCTTTE